MSEPLRFFIGLHHPSAARHFDRCCISVNALRRRKSDFTTADWLMDSGAFTEVSTHGGYRHDVAAYAAEVRRWACCGRLLAAVAQDYMCEPWIVRRTGMSVREHQRLTVDRYDALVDEGLPVHVMPVLQGYLPEDYRRHVEAYGDHLTPGMWVGVGSVCKRNGKPAAVARVLSAIHAVRPDLRLHGFGLKLTALMDPGVRRFLHSADSMAWSYAARREGRNGNSWLEADAYRRRVEAIAARPARGWQLPLPLEARQ